MVFDVRVAHISRYRGVAADAQAIWAVLADFGALSTWAATVDHSCLLQSGAGPIGLSRRVQIGRNTLIERVVEFDENRVLAYTVEGLPRALGDVRNRWELRPCTPSLTTVVLTTTVTIGGRLPHRIAEKLACRFLGTRSDGLLSGLAAQWEDSHVT